MYTIAFEGGRLIPNLPVLIQAREAAGYTVTAMAAACGWTKQYYSQLERGRWATLQPETLETIMKALRDRGILTGIG